MSHILIAYERDAEQTTLEKLLATRGHTVVRAANGLEALDVARREAPEAIVCDVLLPRMDGIALCRKWKQDERLQDVPFVFYTQRYDDPKYERFALKRCCRSSMKYSPARPLGFRCSRLPRPM